METRVNRMEKSKKRGKRALVIAGSAAAMFAVSSGVMASNASLDFTSTAAVSAYNTLRVTLDKTTDSLTQTSRALKQEKANHARDLATANSYHQAVEEQASNADNTNYEKNAQAAIRAANVIQTHDYDANGKDVTPAASSSSSSQN